MRVADYFPASRPLGEDDMITFLKKLPWWIWIAAIIGVIILWQGLSGWSTSQKLYNMMLGDIKKDESQTIKDKEAWIKTCEDEILKIQKEKEGLQRERLIAQEAAAYSAKEVFRLKGENHALRIELKNIVVSDDPDRIIDDLQRRGIKVRRNLGTR